MTIMKKQYYLPKISEVTYIGKNLSMENSIENLILKIDIKT